MPSLVKLGVFLSFLVLVTGSYSGSYFSDEENEGIAKIGLGV